MKGKQKTMETKTENMIAYIMELWRKLPDDLKSKFFLLAKAKFRDKNDVCLCNKDE